MARLLLAPLPFADELRLDIQIAGKHGLADASPLAHGLNFLGRKLLDRCERRGVELPHSLLVELADTVMGESRLVPIGEFVILDAVALVLRELEPDLLIQRGPGARPR
jgi:hypothetical protein